MCRRARSRRVLTSLRNGVVSGFSAWFSRVILTSSEVVRSAFTSSCLGHQMAHRQRVAPRTSLASRGCVLTLGKPPIGQRIEPDFEIRLPIILVVEVVGVLPQITDKHGGYICIRECVVGVMGCADAEFALA